MKKIVGIGIVVVLVLAMGIGIGILVSKKKSSNDDAEKDKNGRYLTIINNTKEILNEVHITVGDGTEIEHAYQNNPDEESFSVEIPKQYNEYETFTVTVIDRNGMEYKKKAKNVKGKGRTEVVIEKDDYVEQEGDLWKKISDWFNGD